MKKFTIYHIFFLILSTASFAQVGVGTTSPETSSALDVSATNKGLLVPRVVLTGSTDIVTIGSPATSLLVYNTATAGTSPNNVIPGYYYYTGTKWERLTNGGANSVGAFTSATANGATITGGVLQLAPASVTTGGIVNTLAQTFDGTKTFNVDAFVNGLTVGKGAGNVSTNSAFGSGALFSVNNINSTNNSAFGFQALNLLTTGTNNNAFGSGALQKTTSGTQNIAIGTNSLTTNITGNYNVGIGHNSLNASDGTGSILSPTTGGSANVAIGSGALSANTTGTFNTAVGFNSGGVSTFTNVAGYKNTLIGANTGFSATNLNNATAIGFGATATASNSIQLGNTAVTNVNTSGLLKTGAVAYPNTQGLAGQVLSTTGVADSTLTWVTPATTATTQLAGDNSTAIATTAFVTAANATNANLTGPITSSGNTTSVALQTGTGTTFVMSASPTLTGTPTLPTGTIATTQLAGDNSTAIATTAFVTAANATNANLTGPITSLGNATSVASQTGTGSTFVMSASPTLTGTPTLPTGTIATTQLAGNNTTAVATTAFVTNANATNANLTGDVTSVGNTTTLSITSVTAGTYGTQTTVPQITVDAKGRVTGVVNTTISPAIAGTFQGDVTGTQSATVVGRINGTSLSGLTTGLLKNTTGTGVPSIAIVGTDYVIPSGNISGNAATATNATNAVNVTITNDNSNNVTGYPTWVTGATTGNLPLKISSSKFTFNPSTGDATINGLTIGLGKNSYATNTVFGVNALSILSNSTAIRNTAIGANTLSGLYLNPDNTAVGYNALLTTQGYQNTAIGSGADALYAVFNCTAIGYGASGSTSNTMQLGNSAVTDIYGGAPTGGAGTGANFRGKAFIVNSDKRIKKDIVNSKYGLATILKLRPVDYTLINDVKHEPQVGFIAQEVKTVVPELVTGKEGDLAKGEILGVNYGGLVPILTKAIQELKKENELQEIEINQLKELVKELINKK